LSSTSSSISAISQRQEGARGTEYCRRAECYDYESYLIVNEIDYTKTEAKTLQANGICERFDKTVLYELHPVILCKKFYAILEELQVGLDVTRHNNDGRSHQGKMCCGRTPKQTLEAGTRIRKEKFVT